MSIFYYNNYFRYIKSRKACLRGAFVSYEGLTNSIRPLRVHWQRYPFTTDWRVQKVIPPTVYRKRSAALVRVASLCYDRRHPQT